MYDDEAGHLLEHLAEIVARSHRSHRDIERAIGVGHGWLRLLFKGQTELKVRHIVDIAAVLGFEPGEFFREVYPAVTGRAMAQVKAKAVDLPEVTGQKPPLSAAARLMVRDIVREELAKLGIQPPQVPQLKEESGEEPEP
jgi:hypothetical protein